MAYMTVEEHNRKPPFKMGKYNLLPILNNFSILFFLFLFPLSSVKKESISKAFLLLHSYSCVLLELLFYLL